MPFRVRPVRDRLLNRVIKATPVTEVRRGASVIEAGAFADQVILVRHGHLAACGGPKGTDSRVIDVVLPWELGATEAVMNGDTRYRWSIVAEERSEIQLLDGSKVRGVLKRSGKSLDAFLTATNDRFELLHELAHSASTRSAAERLWAVLRHLAERCEEGEGVFPYHLTHRTLGDLAGLHRSTVTTILNDWIYRGLLEDRRPGWRLTRPDATPGN